MNNDRSKTTPITIKDIARELNISASTVSRALKNHPDISQDTKKAVTEAALRLDYQPNSIALSLRKQKSNTIGVIVPNIVHHFFSTVLSGIEEVLHGEGYRLLMAQSNESYLREIENIQTMMASRVDGLFISVASEDQDATHLQNLQKRNIPLVFFDRALDDVAAGRVLIDDHDGAFHAVSHLVAQGCRHILHLAGPDKLLISQNRKQGYLDALIQAGISPNEDGIIAADSLQSGYTVVKQLLAQGRQFDGIFTVNDNTAIGAMKALHEAQVRIPDQVCVIGFGDDPVTEIVSPALSSVSQAGDEMGRAVAQLFIEQVAQKAKGLAAQPETRILKTKLVVRASSHRRQ